MYDKKLIRKIAISTIILNDAVITGAKNKRYMPAVLSLSLAGEQGRDMAVAEAGWHVVS